MLLGLSLTSLMIEDFSGVDSGLWVIFGAMVH